MRDSLGMRASIWILVTTIGCGGAAVAPVAATSQPRSSTSTVAAADACDNPPCAAAPTVANACDNNPCVTSATGDPCEGGEVVDLSSAADAAGGVDAPSIGGVAHPSAAVFPGTPTVNGPLPADAIRRVIVQTLPAYRGCYEGELRANPASTGAVDLDFTVDPHGSVSEAAATGISRPLEACLARVTKDLRFPTPTAQGVVEVAYPLVFKTH